MESLELIKYDTSIQLQYTETLMDKAFFLHHLDEADFDELIFLIGGQRAHTDEDRRENVGADYIFNNVAIEFKALNEERLMKQRVQEELSKLFESELLQRPVQVIDRDLLSDDGKRKYERILQSPIKSDVQKAKKQLHQTRLEHQDTVLSVLWFHNNGYDTLSHDDIVSIASRRVRNDTSKIDGIIVSGCYYTSDGFDHEVFFPIEYCSIHGKRFPSFQLIQDAWNNLSEKIMTAMVHGTNLTTRHEKLPIGDIVFDTEQVTFVKPSRILSTSSEFFGRGRPRLNSSGIEVCPSVATVFPSFEDSEWEEIRSIIAREDEMFSNYEAWENVRKRAASQGTPLKPHVSLTVKCAEWETWCERNTLELTGSSVRQFASVLFEAKCREVLFSAREFNDGILKSSYIALSTSEIGMDKANDLSSIALVTEGLLGTSTSELVTDARIFHEHALALASAYAVSKGVSHVSWTKDRTYCWH